MVAESAAVLLCLSSALQTTCDEPEDIEEEEPMKLTIGPDGSRQYEGTPEELREVGLPPLHVGPPAPTWTDGTKNAPLPSRPDLRQRYNHVEAPPCACPIAEPGTIMGWGGHCPLHSFRC